MLRMGSVLKICTRRDGRAFGRTSQVIGRRAGIFGMRRYTSGGCGQGLTLRAGRCSLIPRIKMTHTRDCALDVYMAGIVGLHGVRACNGDMACSTSNPSMRFR